MKKTKKWSLDLVHKVKCPHCRRILTYGAVKVGDVIHCRLCMEDYELAKPIGYRKQGGKVFGWVMAILRKDKCKKGSK